MREVILDTETTGLYPWKGDKIIEIGAIEVIDKIPTGKKFHEYINPQTKISDEAYKAHGISSNFLKDKPLFKDIANALLDFLQDSAIVAHKAKFDVDFLNSEFQTIGYKECITHDRMVCTLKLAASLFPGSPVNLNALCKRFKIDISHRKLHGAFLDAELLMQVYGHMTGHNQITLQNLQSSPQTSYSKNANLMTKQNTKMYHKITRPSEDEKNAHQKMLSGVSKNLWMK